MILVVGLGHVGLVTAACLATRTPPQKVVGYDIDAQRIHLLKSGGIPFVEPNLAELVASATSSENLKFASWEDPFPDADVAFLCLPTPTSLAGSVDLSTILSVVDRIKSDKPNLGVLAIRSTVPVGTSQTIAGQLERFSIEVASNPEFLREGHAVEDFLSSDRVVIGAVSMAAADALCSVYAWTTTKVIQTSPDSAELIKWASNAYIAMKMSFAGTIVDMCDATGARASDVLRGIGADQRIGPNGLSITPGWGGPCLPKDAKALLRFAEDRNVTFELLRAAITANDRHTLRVVNSIEKYLGGSCRSHRIGLLGGTFKPNTSDFTNSPSLSVAEELRRRGGDVSLYDPTMQSTRTTTGSAIVVDDPRAVAHLADILVILTDWFSFRSLDWIALASVMKGSVVFDTCQCLDREAVVSAGLDLYELGYAHDGTSV